MPHDIPTNAAYEFRYYRFPEPNSSGAIVVAINGNHYGCRLGYLRLLERKLRDKLPFEFKVDTPAEVRLLAVHPRKGIFSVEMKVIPTNMSVKSACETMDKLKFIPSLEPTLG